MGKCNYIRWMEFPLLFIFLLLVNCEKAPTGDGHKLEYSPLTVSLEFLIFFLLFIFGIMLFGRYSDILFLLTFQDETQFFHI